MASHSLMINVTSSMQCLMLYIFASMKYVPTSMAYNNQILTCLRFNGHRRYLSASHLSEQNYQFTGWTSKTFTKARCWSFRSPTCTFSTKLQGAKEYYILNRSFSSSSIPSHARTTLGNTFRSKFSNLQYTSNVPTQNFHSNFLQLDATKTDPNNELSSPFMKLTISTPEDMEDVGSVLTIGSQKGDIIFLDGDLGAGKTCFSRGFVRAKTGMFDAKVTSPTYLLSNTYTAVDDITVHHMDLYRLSGSKEDFEPLNLPFVFKECISLIEWPIRLGSLIPDERLDVTIQICDETGERIVLMIPHGNMWIKRLQDLEEEGYLDDLMITEEEEE